MMERPTPHSTKGAPFVHLCKKAATPLEITAVRPCSYEGRLYPIPRNPFGETPVLGGVFFRSKVPATTPRLVANTPVPDLEGISLASCFSRLSQRCRSRRRVAILDPFIEVSRSEASNVRCHVRLRS